MALRTRAGLCDMCRSCNDVSCAYVRWCPSLRSRKIRRREQGSEPSYAACARELVFVAVNALVPGAWAALSGSAVQSTLLLLLSLTRAASAQHWHGSSRNRCCRAILTALVRTRVSRNPNAGSRFRHVLGDLQLMETNSASFYATSSCVPAEISAQAQSEQLERTFCIGANLSSGPERTAFGVACLDNGDNKRISLAPRGKQGLYSCHQVSCFDSFPNRWRDCAEADCSFIPKQFRRKRLDHGFESRSVVKLRCAQVQSRESNIRPFAAIFEGGEIRWFCGQADICRSAVQQPGDYRPCQQAGDYQPYRALQSGDSLCSWVWLLARLSTPRPAVDLCSCSRLQHCRRRLWSRTAQGLNVASLPLSPSPSILSKVRSPTTCRPLCIDAREGTARKKQAYTNIDVIVLIHAHFHQLASLRTTIKEVGGSRAQHSFFATNRQQRGHTVIACSPRLDQCHQLLSAK
ncbi:hypothetical protein MRB53_037642 [Persea americana]|nr:hypothetical protein MRB53_037642 [Persea americana]